MPAQVTPEVVAAVRARFGAHAADALAQAPLPSGERVRVRELGALAWLEVGDGFSARAWFYAGAWTKHEGVAAFERAVVEARPTLDASEDAVRALVGAYTHLTTTDPLLTREQLEDFADPRWSVFPLTKDEMAQWEPPHMEDGALVFVVHEKGTLSSVRITPSYAVEVRRRE